MLPLVLVLVAGVAPVAVGDVFAFRSAHTDAGDTLVAERPHVPDIAARVAPERRPANGSLAVFAVCAALYLLVGAYVVLHRGGIIGDAAARVAAGLVRRGQPRPPPRRDRLRLEPVAVGGRDSPRDAARHLARHEKMYAGVIVSALCMAGAVVQLRGLLRDIGASTDRDRDRGALRGEDPMVIAYGGERHVGSDVPAVPHRHRALPDRVDGQRTSPTARAHRDQPRVGLPHV